MANKVIMAWSKCKVEIGDTGENDAFPEDSALTHIGYTVDKTAKITSEDGDSLQAKASGGEVVAEDQNEGSMQFECQILEPTDEVFEFLGLGSISNDELKVKTHIVPGDKAIKLTPKNKGAKGAKMPVCRISCKYETDEEAGNTLTLTAKVFKTTNIAAGEDGADNNYWYSRFTTTEALT